MQGIRAVPTLGLRTLTPRGEHRAAPGDFVSTGPRTSTHSQTRAVLRRACQLGGFFARVPGGRWLLPSTPPLPVLLTTSTCLFAMFAALRQAARRAPAQARAFHSTPASRGAEEYVAKARAAGQTAAQKAEGACRSLSCLSSCSPEDLPPRSTRACAFGAPSCSAVGGSRAGSCLLIRNPLRLEQVYSGPHGTTPR